VWNKGDVFAGIGNGTYNVYDGTTGLFKDSISSPVGGATTGCNFTPNFARLYTTYFDANKVVVYDDDAANTHAILDTFDTTDPNLTGKPTRRVESVVFANGTDFFLGHAATPPALTPGANKIQLWKGTNSNSPTHTSVNTLTKEFDPGTTPVGVEN